MCWMALNTGYDSPSFSKPPPLFFFDAMAGNAAARRRGWLWRQRRVSKVNEGQILRMTQWRMRPGRGKETSGSEHVGGPRPQLGEHGKINACTQPAVHRRKDHRAKQNRQTSVCWQGERASRSCSGEESLKRNLIFFCFRKTKRPSPSDSPASARLPNA